MNTKLKKNIIGHLDQADCVVFATKAMGAENSRTEGTRRTVKLTVIDKRWREMDADYDAVVELETYIVNLYGNKKHWRKILDALDTDCVVQLNSADGVIPLVRRDETMKKNQHKSPLIDADTPFQITDTYGIDQYGNCVVFDFINQVNNRLV